MGRGREGAAASGDGHAEGPSRTESSLNQTDSAVEARVVALDGGRLRALHRLVNELFDGQWLAAIAVAMRVWWQCNFGAGRGVEAVVSPG